MEEGGKEDKEDKKGKEDKEESKPEVRMKEFCSKIPDPNSLSIKNVRQCDFLTQMTTLAPQSSNSTVVAIAKKFGLRR